MEKIEEFTDIFRKSAEYEKLDRKFKLVCNKGIQETLQYITKFGLNNSKITELQAWKKIAETTDTDEPTFNPADFYHDMRILFKHADLNVPVRGDKTLYDNGYRIVHKSSLPTKQDKVLVPEFVAEYLEMRKEQFPVGGLGVAIIYVLDGKGSPELFNWINSNVEIFARAWLDGYTVEKEPLFTMPVPYTHNGNLHYCLKDNGEISFRQGNAYKFTQDQIDKYFPEIKAMAVPVEEEE
ncbi:DUF1642 domain-containing protein [Candidatus Enterococcus ikei]|uniref:DUF1642 domain-containing protein n=1 Tax=Candidatus Enterococcus ikei TaxID=2815326 RepID=A0ABS3GUK5_9ENTE|nr:DUF1642 domain-containing protein [Enterococcus sp. DIV0869a]MBO0438942.1 DUF1642 domain-containing protein [Enterococcus sp. DIV0869a]